MSTPLEEGFWEQVERCAHGERCRRCCWLWKRVLRGSLYGSFSWQGQSCSAHRLSLMLARGASLLSSQFYVLHRCDTPLCVNPHHLFVGTAKDNSLDRFAKNRWRVRQRVVSVDEESGERPTRRRVRHPAAADEEEHAA